MDLMYSITVFQLQVTVLVTGDQEYKDIFKASLGWFINHFKGLSWQILMPQTAPQKDIPVLQYKSSFCKVLLDLVSGLMI